jgi:hypothetical protein
MGRVRNDPSMPWLPLGIQILVFVGIAVCAVWPRLRRRVAAGLIGVGVACGIVMATQGASTRTLEITHRFSAYVELQVRSKTFPIETVTADGSLWALIGLLFCGLWAAAVLLVGARVRAFAVPLGLAWTGVACQLLLEKAAAPAILVAPFDLAPDRVLFPATLACAFLLARKGRKILHLFLYLSLFIAVTRLPIALFGTLATRGEWGTHLDVHRTVFFVPPGGATSIGPIEVAAGGTEQLFWLIWAPHLIVYPLFYMMSAGGFAFLRLMWQRQKEVDAA